MIPLAVVMVRFSILEASAFYGCHEPGLCDERFYTIVADRGACDARMSDEFMRRIDSGWLYDSDNVGIFAACQDLKLVILHKMCSPLPTLHEIAECERIRAVFGSHPRHAAKQDPVTVHTRHGVSVLEPR